MDVLSNHPVRVHQAARPCRAYPASARARLALSAQPAAQPRHCKHKQEPACECRVMGSLRSSYQPPQDHTTTVQRIPFARRGGRGQLTWHLPAGQGADSSAGGTNLLCIVSNFRRFCSSLRVSDAAAAPRGLGLGSAGRDHLAPCGRLANQNGLEGFRAAISAPHNPSFVVGSALELAGARKTPRCGPNRPAAGRAATAEPGRLGAFKFQ